MSSRLGEEPRFDPKWERIAVVSEINDTFANNESSVARDEKGELEVLWGAMLHPRTGLAHELRLARFESAHSSSPIVRISISSVLKIGGARLPPSARFYDLIPTTFPDTQTAAKWDIVVRRYLRSVVYYDQRKSEVCLKAYQRHPHLLGILYSGMPGSDVGMNQLLRVA